MKNVPTSNAARRILIRGAFALILAGAHLTALAQIPYGNPGVPNPNGYTFTASSTGDVVGYFAAYTGANFDEQVGMIDATTDPTLNLTGISFGLDNHSSTPGQSFDFGPVNAGDTLIFVDQIEQGGNGSPISGYVYSEPSLNIPYDTDGSLGHNHVYSTAVGANSPFLTWSNPAGTYVGFEDLPFPGSDFNYSDDTFVFTDISTQTSPVPDAASTLALLGGALTGMAAFRRRFAR
jgi:hypothetical protein